MASGKTLLEKTLLEKTLLEKRERMEVALKEIASFGRNYPTSAPEHEIRHALVVGVPDIAHRGLQYIPD